MLLGLEFQPPDGPHTCQGKGSHIGYCMDNVDNWNICGKPAPHFCALRERHGFVPEPVLRQGGMYLCDEGLHSLEEACRVQEESLKLGVAARLLADAYVEGSHIPIWSHGPA